MTWDSNDRTLLAVCHAERTSVRQPPTVVLDRLHVLSGARERPAEPAAVGAIAYEAATAYRASIRLDPWQAVDLAHRLRARGVSVEEWTFSPVSVGRLAMNVHLLLRERRFALPDDAALLSELATVRLKETMPGVFWLDHDSGHHDDHAVSLGPAALTLPERVDHGRGQFIVPRGELRRRLVDARPPTWIIAGIRRAARAGPRLPGSALIVPGSANEPRR